MFIVSETLPGVQVLISLKGLALNDKLLLRLRVAPKMAQLYVQMVLCVTLMEAQLYVLLHRAHIGHH